MDVQIEAKLDKIATDISEINQTLIRNTVSLEYHVKRTDLAEARMEAIASDLKPIQEHVSKVHGALKLLSILAVVLAIAASIRSFV